MCWVDQDATGDECGQGCVAPTSEDGYWEGSFPTRHSFTWFPNRHPLPNMRGKRTKSKVVKLPSGFPVVADKHLGYFGSRVQGLPCKRK